MTALSPLPRDNSTVQCNPPAQSRTVHQRAPHRSEEFISLVKASRRRYAWSWSLLSLPTLQDPGSPMYPLAVGPQAVMYVQQEMYLYLVVYFAVIDLTFEGIACVALLGLDSHVELAGCMRSSYACPAAILSLAPGTSCQFFFYSGLLVTRKNPRGRHATSALLVADYRRLRLVFDLCPSQGRSLTLPTRRTSSSPFW